ncbi:hypothetical protein CH35J_003955 [Colletotrichum higginsianum]|uniref:Zn(2)-C6 fungal-type domain-containing protein n=1 Tax=Colletotrichum higginsianum TaxID=80884 RepID=A0A4T0WBN2_9PEZI|nr:hypothetical protein CH35J_003955 [Colletotrichum higginsianum]
MEYSYTCKERHTPCDEKKPVCGNCERLRLSCRPFEPIKQSAWSAPDGTNHLTRRPRQHFQQQQQQQNLFQADEAEASFPGTLDSTGVLFTAHMPGPPWNTTAGTSPSPPKQTASIPHPQHPQQGVGVVVVEDSNGGNGGSSSTSDIISRAQVTLTAEMVHLLTTYRTSVATWMDIFDYGCAYQLEVLRRCMTSKLLVRSVCAFTAKHLSLLPSGDVWVAPATRYYGESLRGLIGYIGTGSVPEDVLTATILLCSYEIIATQGEEHQRHLAGAKLLILNRGVSASSVGLDRANFWIYIRHEITVALFNKTTLQISPRDWRVNWRETEVEEDVLANQLLWLLGRAIDVVFRQEQSVFTTTATLCDERQEIYAEVATWFRCWSPSFKGVKYGEPDDQGFSKLYFPVPCAAAAMMCVRSFSSQAIFYAAKHITGISRKIRLWNMLDDIETRLGFRTRDQVKKLKELVETNI